jgi:exopolysaccharide production protein ExoZ
VPVPHRLRILQLYRGIGAMLVVLFHLTWYGGQPVFLQSWMHAIAAWVPLAHEGKPVPGFFLFGHSGVDLFIILSGFVMVWGYGEQAGKLGRVLPYLRARFVRIYPTYWAIWAISVLYLRWHPGMNDRALEPPLLLRGFFIYGRNVNWQIPPAWTLPFEVALYIFFTLLIAAGWAAFGIGAVLWCGAILGTWYGGWRLGFHPILISHLVLEFFLGCLGALLVLRLRPRVSGIWLTLAIVACIAVGVVDAFGVVAGSHHDLRNFALPFLIVIVLGAGYELARERTYPRLLMVIGDASFSIYLCHFYLMHELNRIFGRYPWIHEAIGRDAERALMFVLLVTMGVIAWMWIERPLLSLFAPRRSSSAPRAADG